MSQRISDLLWMLGMPPVLLGPEHVVVAVVVALGLTSITWLCALRPHAIRALANMFSCTFTSAFVVCRAEIRQPHLSVSRR